jgi:hypothetical protein
MIGYIISLDQYLLHLVNGVWVSPALDRLMPALSAVGNLGVVWLGLLGALATLGGKTGRKMGLAGLIALAIGFVTSDLIKEITMLSRPVATLPDVRLLVAEHGSYALPLGGPSPAPSLQPRAPCSPRKGSWGGCRRGAGKCSHWPPPSPTPESTSASTGRRTSRPGYC